LEGTAEIGGAVAANPEVPTVNVNGVVSAGSYSATAVPSPGELVSIFGVRLANAFGEAPSLPLPTELEGATLVLGGKPLPLRFTSENQVNAIIPYDLAQPTTHQLIARRGNRLSVPEPVTIAAAQPAIFTTDLSGRGQGHIYAFATATEFFLADRANPAKAGDVLVIYCTGLGPVDPPVAAGTAAPFDRLTRTVNPVTVTIGGRPASVAFAGLTAGFAGLYQVNVTVPGNVAAGDQVQVVLSVSGVSSPAVTMAVR
ncbi:MAG: hypothetical protein ACREN5_17065, partial [Gemmatimonadales bacterium]